MKVQLIVVQGRPEGKVIPLVGPEFKIGRGETCHLRPNSEQVSREHAAFMLVGDALSVRDLGSRNGTHVNGKPVKDAVPLKDRDLVQVGPLTFAVSIIGAPLSESKAASPAAKAKGGSPDDVSHDEIETWLVSDGKSPAPERPSGIYGGDTITIAAYKDGNVPKPPEPTKSMPAPAKPAASAPAKPAAAAPAKPAAAAAAPAAKPAPAAPKPATSAPKPAPAEDDEPEYERLPEGMAGEEEEEAAENRDEENEGEDAEEQQVDEYVDESNPFYVKKKVAETAAPSKPVYKDTSDAASDILRKMMERRRGPRS